MITCGIPVCGNPFSHMMDHNSVSGCIGNLIPPHTHTHGFHPLIPPSPLWYTDSVINLVNAIHTLLPLHELQKILCAPLSLNGTLMGHWNSCPHLQHSQTNPLLTAVPTTTHTTNQGRVRAWNIKQGPGQKQCQTGTECQCQSQTKKKEVLPRWNQTTYSLPHSVDEGHCLDFVRQVCWNGTTTTRLTRNSPQGTWMS